MRISVHQLAALLATANVGVGSAGAAIQPQPTLSQMLARIDTSERLYSPRPDAQGMEARSGCCSHHGGVAGCDTATGHQECNDGTDSPTCGCGE
jgi:hypothetical protein